MRSLGLKKEVPGSVLLTELAHIDITSDFSTGRPTKMPPLAEGDVVFCALERFTAPELILCESLAEMQELYNIYAVGGAITIKWYTGNLAAILAYAPDTGKVVVKLASEDQLNELLDLSEQLFGGFYDRVPRLHEAPSTEYAAGIFVQILKDGMEMLRIDSGSWSIDITKFPADRTVTYRFQYHDLETYYSVTRPSDGTTYLTGRAPIVNVQHDSGKYYEWHDEEYRQIPERLVIRDLETCRKLLSGELVIEQKRREPQPIAPQSPPCAASNTTGGNAS